MTLLSPVDRNLILTGYTGPNQPAIAQQVASQIGMRFINVDLLLEDRAEMSLGDLRSRFGEARLKTLEAEVMRDVLLYRGVVLRVGGQTLLHADYAPRLQATGPIICLVVTLDAVLRRLHLQLGARYHNPNERALAIAHLKREWAVRQLAGIHELDVTYINEAETISAVTMLWRETVL
jgi:shikimate kinase